MKILSIILICFLSLFQSDIGIVRNSFKQASLSLENAQKFYKDAQNTKVSNNTFLISAYQGAASVTLSKFQKDKKLRKELLTEGIIKIEESIKNDPQQVELRLIRLIIQEKLPKFIKYNKNIEEDKSVILSNYKVQEPDLKKWIEEYSNSTKIFTEQEKNIFSK